MFFLFFSCSFSFNRYWCEPPHWEYKPLQNADILQVQVLTRHGARTPLHSPNNDINVWKCNNTEFKQFEFPESHPMKINFAFGKSIFGGECRFGQLLDRGNAALKRLGAFLRKTYITEMKFLPTNYNEKNCEFRTTATHRTIHSAMALIEGLYPEHDEIIINIADKDLDTFRRSSLVCPNLKKRIGDMKANKEFKAKYDDDLAEMKKAAKALNVSMGDSFDIVMASRCSDLPLSSSFDDSILDHGSAVKAKMQLEIFSHDTIFPLVFSFPLAEIVNTFVDRINGKSKLKFKHWSGHNGNIFGLLAYLGETIDKIPPYGSYFIMELWKRRDDGKNIVRFNYNGRTLAPPRIGKGENIPIEYLVKFLNDNMPDLSKDCGFKFDKIRKSTVSNPEDA